MNEALTDKRNIYGVKASCDMYRHIKGQLYVHWTSCDVARIATLLRKVKIRVKVIKGELFIHEQDKTTASKMGDC